MLSQVCRLGDFVSSCLNTPVRSCLTTPIGRLAWPVWLFLLRGRAVSFRVDLDGSARQLIARIMTANLDQLYGEPM